jgi:L-threonylcarbamoyladenylate synthase
MKYTHYAPKGELTVVECKASDSSGQKKVAEKINKLVNEKLSSGFRVAVIATEETRELYKCPHILTIGSAGKGETVAARLYAVLRECDELRADYIYSEAFNYGELGNAIMNRLLKAAVQRVIYV